jgi:hypothetical protein
MTKDNLKDITTRILGLSYAKKFITDLYVRKGYLDGKTTYVIFYKERPLSQEDKMSVEEFSETKQGFAEKIEDYVNYQSPLDILYIRSCDSPWFRACKPGDYEQLWKKEIIS